MIKVTWREVAPMVKKINPEFYDLMQPFSDINYPLYIAKYKYGQYFGKGSEILMPAEDGGLYQLGGNKTPHNIMRDLGYGKDSFPLAMILDKYCEWNEMDENTGFRYPKRVQGPGTICNKEIIFKQDISMENKQTSACSGVGTVFMLPYIGCKKSHSKIQNELDISIEAPKSYYDHSKLIGEILVKSQSSHDWKSSFLFFSEKWVLKMREDTMFGPLREYFLETLWKKEKNKSLFTNDTDPFMSSVISNEINPTPFTLSSTRYLFNLMFGSSMGFAPTTNNDYIPVKTLQDIYTNCYKIKYTPSIMIPMEYNGKTPIYYSLQYPFIGIGKKKAGGKKNSSFQELAALGSVLNTFKYDFSKDKENSPLKTLCLNSEFNYFHHKAATLEAKENTATINPSAHIKELDRRFDFSFYNALHFSSDAKFFRGCIQLTKASQDAN